MRLTVRQFTFGVLAAAVTVLTGALPRRADAVMQLTPIVSHPAAVCNDGTQANYYLELASPASPQRDRWVIHLEGGAFCGNCASCDARKVASPALVTAATAPTYSGGGILSTSAAANPDFSGANHVFIHYCSSDFWSGNGTATCNSGTETWTFHGSAVVGAVIDELMPLLTGPSCSPTCANLVVLAGSSAGGVGVVVQLDAVRASLPSSIQVVGVNDAGWGVDVATYNPGLPTVEQQAQQAHAFWNATLDASCESSAQFSAQPWLCVFGRNLFPFITTPLFVQMSQHDTWQLGNLGLGGPYPPTSPSAIAYDNNFAASVRSSLCPILCDAGAGLFSPTTYTHTAVNNSYFSSTVLVGGNTFESALHSWLFGGPPGSHLIEGGVPACSCGSPHVAVAGGVPATPPWALAVMMAGVVCAFSWLTGRRRAQL